MKAIVKKATLVALVLSTVVLTGCNSTPFYGVNDQAQVNVNRQADGSTTTTCVAQGRGVNACPDQMIIDINSSNHKSSQVPVDGEAAALKKYCRIYTDHPDCKE